MNKKLLSCLLAFALICTLAFSAGAVSMRSFVADAAPPVDDSEVFIYNVYTDDSEEATYYLGVDDPEEATDYLGAENPDAGTETEQEKSPVKSALICVVIGVVIALLVTLSVKSSYKPVQRRRDAAEYLVNGSLQVTAANETFVRSEVTERTIENKTSQNT